MKPKRVFRCGCFLLILCMLFIHPVSADVGDKPSLVITFENMPDAVFYGGLLSDNVPGDARYNTEHYDVDLYGEELEPIFAAFCAYDDTDGFLYWQKIFPCSEQGTLVWGDLPPDTFKLLLYFPETDTYAVSDILEKYAHDASFVLDLDGVVPSDGAHLDVRADYHLPAGIGGLLLRMVLTVLLELGVAWLFRYRTKPLVTRIIAVNVITQILLNLALVCISFKVGGFAAFIAYFLLEIPVLLIEAITYAIILPDHRGGTWWKAVLYAIAANLVSFLVGYRLSLHFPIIF